MKSINDLTVISAFVCFFALGLNVVLENIITESFANEKNTSTQDSIVKSSPFPYKTSLVPTFDSLSKGGVRIRKMSIC